MGVEDKIGNGHLLTDIFGRWPSFHDAEVLRMTLDSGELTPYGPWPDTTIHVFEMTPQVENGAYVLRHHTAVTFRFVEIYELKLEGFIHQNVLWALRIQDISDRQLERIKFEVSFAGTFGMSASLQCNSLNIESVEPFVPDSGACDLSPNPSPLAERGTKPAALNSCGQCPAKQ